MRAWFFERSCAPSGAIGAKFIAAAVRTLCLLSLTLATACAPHVELPGAHEAEPRLDPCNCAVVVDDGARLPLRVWGLEIEAPQAVVLGLHGFGDHAGAFNRAGGQLARSGIRTYAIDQRGFGRAAGRGLWHGTDRMSADVAVLVRLLAERHAPAPVYLLGLSMGGAVAMVTAGDRPNLPLAGIALVAPAVWGRDFMPGYQREALSISAHTVPWYPLTGGGLRIRPTDNEAVLREMARDPHMLRAFRVDTVWGLANLMDRAQAVAPHLALPALYLYGLRDELVPKLPTGAVLAAMPAEYRRIAIYRDGYHMLLRDRNGAAPVADLTAWFLAPNEPLPSGAEAKAAALLPPSVKGFDFRCLPTTDRRQSAKSSKSH